MQKQHHQGRGENIIMFPIGTEILHSGTMQDQRIGGIVMPQ